MNGHTDLLNPALRRLRASVLLPLIGGNLLLSVAAVLALLIPDSHAWQLLLSLLLALGLVAGLLLWNALGIRRLRASAQPVPLWVGALFLGGWLIVAALLFHVATLATPNIETRAGYWNSQLPAGLRHLFPYTRLVTLQEFAISAFRWVLLPALLTPFVIETVTFGFASSSLARALRTLLSARHWVTAVPALGLAAWLVPKLTAWHPSHSVSGETLSALIRLGVAALLAISAALLLLAVDAELLHRRTLKKSDVGL